MDLFENGAPPGLPIPIKSINIWGSYYPISRRTRISYQDISSWLAKSTTSSFSQGLSLSLAIHLQESSQRLKASQSIIFLRLKVNTPFPSVNPQFSIVKYAFAPWIRQPLRPVETAGCWTSNWHLSGATLKSRNFPMEKVELYNWKCGNIAFSHVWTYSVYVTCNYFSWLNSPS